MMINAVYLANWKEISSRHQTQIQKNNALENHKRIPYVYSVGEMVYLCKSNVEQKLNPLQGPFRVETVHSNGTVTIQRSSIVSERINIRRLHPASPRSNKRMPHGCS